MKDKIKITVEEAKKCIKFDEEDMVHTFYNLPFGLIGADHSKESIYKDLEEAQWIEITGESGKAMKHAIAIIPKASCKHSQILFVESDMDEVNKLEKKKAVNYT